MSSLNPAEMRAWRAFLDAQAAVLRRLEADLIAEDQLTVAEYDVLVQLEVAAEHQLRMSDLSNRVRLSRSGLTRLVDRMVSAGLLERRDCPSDRRVTFARLSPAGVARLHRAAPTHLRGIGEYFARHLSPSQLEAIATALEPIGASMPREHPALS